MRIDVGDDEDDVNEVVEVLKVGRSVTAEAKLK